MVVFAGELGAVRVRRAMREAGRGSTPFVTWEGIFTASGSTDGSYLQLSGDAAEDSYYGHTAIAPPRADFVAAYRAAFGEEPTEYAAAAYACVEVILASLEAVAEDGPDAGELREALRAYAVDPAHDTRPCSARWGSTSMATRHSSSSRCSASTPKPPT